MNFKEYLSGKAEKTSVHMTREALFIRRMNDEVSDEDMAKEKWISLTSDTYKENKIAMDIAISFWNSFEFLMISLEAQHNKEIYYGEEA